MRRAEGRRGSGTGRLWRMMTEEFKKDQENKGRGGLTLRMRGIVEERFKNGRNGELGLKTSRCEAKDEKEELGEYWSSKKKGRRL